MGLTFAALVVAIFALQKTVIGEEIVRTVRYVPNPSNLPSVKYGVLHSFKANLPDNVTWNETTINNSNNTEIPTQSKQNNYESTDVYKFSPKPYGSNTQYQPHAYSNNLHRYQEEQIKDKMEEKYESLNKENNNQGYVLRFENSDVVTKCNQNKNKYEENQISQMNNKNQVSDIEILESQNYQENKAINLKSTGRKNCVKHNVGEIQLKESENILHLSDSLSHEHGSDIQYEKITQVPKLHKTIHHNHAAVHNTLSNHNLVHNIRTPVPVSKTATYSINYLYPINGYNVKNVGRNLFLYKTNNNEENYTDHHPQEDEEIGESDLDHLPNHSYVSFADSVDNKYTTTNEKEIDVGRQTFITDESLEVVENVKLIKTGEDFYTKVLDIKEKNTANTEKGLTSQITIKDDENLDMSQLKKEGSSCQINKVKGREDAGYIVDSHDNINEKLILHTNGVSSNAKEFGTQSTKLNFYEDNSDYFTRDNLDVKEYFKYDYENARPYQTYKYFDTDFVPKDYSEIEFSNNNPIGHKAENKGHSDNEYISNEGAKITISSENHVISNYDADIKDSNYEYIPKHIAGIKTYEYVDGDNKDQKYEYDVGKYESIYSGTDKNEFISRYYAEILKQGAHYANDDTEDSGYGHYEYIQPNGELYNNEYNNGGTSSNDNAGYKHYWQEEYITKDDSESPEYYNNAENVDHRLFEKAISIDGTEKLIEKDQYTLKYNYEPSEYNHEHLVDYNYSPKIYSHTEEPESGFGAHQQYNYISKTGALYDGYDRDELHSKYDSRLTESDESYYISKYDIDSGKYRGYENILEIKGDDDIVKDYKIPKYFAKDGEYQGYEQYEYVERDGSEYGVIDNNEYILNSNQDIREFDHNPSIIAASEIRLPIDSAKHSIFNEPVYSTTDSEHASEIYVAPEAEKDIPYGYYVDKQGQYYGNVHLKDWSIGSFYKNEHSIISEYNNKDFSTISEKGSYDILTGNVFEDKYINTKNENNANRYLFKTDDNVHESDSIYDNENILIYSDQSKVLNNDQVQFEEPILYNLNDGLTYGSNSYLPLIYKSHKNGYKSYDSDFNSQAEVQDLLYSQKPYIPQMEKSYDAIVDSHDGGIHLRNWPVSINKFDPEFFFSVNEEELTKLYDDDLIVKTNVNEPHRTSNFPYSEKEELEVGSYGEKTITLESSDEEGQNSEITEFPSKLVFNDIKYSYPGPLDYHTNHDIKENYEGIISESLETPFLVDVNKEDEENDEYFAPETKCSHPHGHNVNGNIKLSLQHNSDQKSACNCFKTELDDNPLAVDNIDGKFYFETLRQPPVISVGAHHNQNGLDSFKIKHPTIVLDSDPISETKVNKYHSSEDLYELSSAEHIKCKQCYSRKSLFPKNHKVKQFSPIPTFPINQNYEIYSPPIKQSKLKSSLSNSRFSRSSEIVSASPDSNISQRSLS